MKMEEKRVIAFNEAEIETAKAILHIWDKYTDIVAANKLKSKYLFGDFVDAIAEKGELDLK